jgi:hypothetical protein
MTNADHHAADESSAIHEHDDLDPETIAEDVEDLFRPDNTQVPPPSPDAPPPAD